MATLLHSQLLRWTAPVRQPGRRLLVTCLAALLLICGLFSSPLSAADTTAESGTEESWSVIYMSGQRVGYGRSIVRKEQRDRQTIYLHSHEEHVTMRRFGQEIKMISRTKTEETDDGHLLNYVFEMENPPAQSKRSVGTVEGRSLKIETTIAGRTSTRTLNWNDSIRSPLYQDRLLRKKPLKPGESLSFRVFMPELTNVADIRMQADDYREVKLHDGSLKKLLKVRMSQSVLPGIEMRAYLDENGEALRVEAGLLDMVTWTVPKEVALQEIAGAELDVTVNTLIEVKNPPADVHRQNSAVYRITTPGRDPFEFIPNGDTQQVTRTSDDSAEIAVTALRPGTRTPASRNAPKTYLGETDFLQVSDARVQDHARRAAAGAGAPTTIAIQMEKYVHKNLKQKNFSTALASAAEVARNMEGDCTEHACLLAAMLRAKQIPSRVAVGLVYAERYAAFAGHMWTEAWLGGKWVPLDATLGKGGIGVGHIKLADSDLSNEGPTPVLSFLPLMNVLEDVSIECIRISR
ncbi:MAG: transglutaminase-like domain-containing protein [Planctomycetota bacterium]|jgi:transglutaminase-like putative cysteine protease